MPQGGCLGFQQLKRNSGILEGRGMNLEGESAADRLSGVAGEIDPENQGPAGVGNERGLVAESKAWCFHAVRLITFNRLHRFTPLSGNIYQGLLGQWSAGTALGGIAN